MKKTIYFNLKIFYSFLFFGFFCLNSDAATHQVFAHWGMIHLNTELLNRLGYWTDGGHRNVLNAGHSVELNQIAIEAMRISFAQRGAEKDTASSYDGGAGLYIAHSPASWALDDRLGDDLLIVEFITESPLKIPFLGHNAVKQNYLKYRRGELSEQNLPVIIEYLQPDAFLIQRLPREDEKIRILIRPPTEADAEALWNTNTEGKNIEEILNFIGKMSYVLEHKNYAGGTLMVFEKVVYEFGYNFIQRNQDHFMNKILTKEEKNDFRKLISLYLKKQNTSRDKMISLIQIYKNAVLKPKQNDLTELEDLKGFEMIYDYLSTDEKKQWIALLNEEIKDGQGIIEKQTYRWIRLADKISSIESKDSQSLFNIIKLQVLYAISRKAFNPNDVQFNHVEGESNKIFRSQVASKAKYTQNFTLLPAPLGSKIETFPKKKADYFEYELGAKQSFYDYRLYPELMSDFFKSIFDLIHSDENHPELKAYHFLYAFKLIYARLVSEEVKQKLLPILKSELLSLGSMNEFLNSFSILDFEKVMLNEANFQNFNFETINDIAHGICIDFRPLCEKIIKDLEGRSQFKVLNNSNLNFDPRGLANQLKSFYPPDPTFFFENQVRSAKEIFTCGDLFH